MIKLIIKGAMFILPSWVQATPLDCSYSAKLFDNNDFQNKACNVIENLQEYHGVVIKEYTIDYNKEKQRVDFQCDSGNGFINCSISDEIIKI